MAQQKHTLEGQIIFTAESKGIKKASQEATNLAKQIQKVDKAFRQNIETQEQTRAAIRKLNQANKQASEEWEVLHKDIDRLGASMGRLEQEAKELAAATSSTTDATEKQVVASRQLEAQTKEVTEFTEKQNREIRESKEAFQITKKAIQQTEVQLERFNEEQKDTFVSAKASTDAIQQEKTMIKRLKNELDPATVKLKAQSAAQLQMATSAAKAKMEQKFLGVEVGRLKDSLATALSIGGVMGLALAGINLLREGMQRAGEAVKQFQRDATESFSNLQEEVARTKAQIPALIQSQKELYDIAVRTAKEIGRGTLETQVAIRKAMNLGLEYNEALTAVEISTKAARVANADMTDTLITGMSTVNAYGRGMYDISAVLDQYAYVTQNSNLETQDLISGMAKIISPAAEAGVSLEEVAAAMIVMNRQGDDFTEIADLLGNMLTQIAVRGTTLGTAFEEAAGMGFRDFTAAGGTLVEGLILIEEHAKKTDQSVSELAQGNSKFYRDMLAGRGILELTGRHTAELAEAYEGATTATGTLDQQTAEFTDTLYLATEQMEAAKEEAWAVEGSLTKGLAMGWVNWKKSFYEAVTDVSKGMAIFQQIHAAAEEQPRYNAAELEWIAKDIDSMWGESSRTREEQQVATEAIVKLMGRLKTVSEEEFRIAADRAVAEYHRLQQADEVIEKSKKQLAIVTEEERFRLMGQKDRAKAAAEAEAELKRQVALEEDLVTAAGKRAAFEQEVTDRLLEQRKILGEAYTASKGMIDNISALQEQLAASIDPEEQETLEQQIKEAGDAIGKHYRQNIVDAMIANDGYTESITDMKVAMGLITEEAGEIEKNFIRIVTEGKKLAELEGFKDLDFESQAAAADALADGIARTAEEAFALYDPTRWAEGLPFGLTKAEEPFQVIPEVIIPTEEMDKLTEMQEQLEAITEPIWQAKVEALTLSATSKLNLLDEKINEIVHDYEMTITVKTVFTQEGSPGPGIPENSFAGGGSFTVPAGYNSDNYLVGVSSGENVTVTASGQSMGERGVSVSMANYFAAGVYNQQRVARGTRDGLYRALEELGLTP